MYSRLESYPVTTTHPADPHHQILRYPLTKSAVLSSQVPIQAAFPRPTLFISSSRSSSHSSTPGSSPEFSTEDVNQYPISVAQSSTMSSQHPSLSHRALLQGRPLPQVPPLPIPPAPIQPPTNASLTNASTLYSSPLTSPSSPTTLHRPKRALPIIPPSPHTPQMTCPSQLSASPATPSVGSSDPHTPSPQSSSSAEPFTKLHVNLSIDLSPTTAVIHRLPPLRRQQPQTRIAVRRVNAEASSSKVQLPPRPPVLLQDLIPPPPPPRPKLKVQTPPLTRALTNRSRRESPSNDRPKLRIQTPSLAEPNSAPFVRTRSQVPQRIHPLPRVPTQTEPASRALNLARRSSLDSLTTRSSALLSPGQTLTPYVSKQPRSRRFSKSPQQYTPPESVLTGAPGSDATGTRIVKTVPAAITGRGDRRLVGGDDVGEPISPIKFTQEGSDGERDDEDPNFGLGVASPGPVGRSAAESRAYFCDHPSCIVLADLLLSFCA